MAYEEWRLNGRSYAQDDPRSDLTEDQARIYDQVLAEAGWDGSDCAAVLARMDVDLGDRGAVAEALGGDRAGWRAEAIAGADTATVQHLFQQFVGDGSERNPEAEALIRHLTADLDRRGVPALTGQAEEPAAVAAFWAGEDAGADPPLSLMLAWDIAQEGSETRQAAEAARNAGETLTQLLAGEGTSAGHSATVYLGEGAGDAVPLSQAGTNNVRLFHQALAELGDAVSPEAAELRDQLAGELVSRPAAPDAGVVWTQDVDGHDADGL